MIHSPIRTTQLHYQAPMTYRPHHQRNPCARSRGKSCSCVLESHYSSAADSIGISVQRRLGRRCQTTSSIVFSYSEPSCHEVTITEHTFCPLVSLSPVHEFLNMIVVEVLLARLIPCDQAICDIQRAPSLEVE